MYPEVIERLYREAARAGCISRAPGAGNVSRTSGAGNVSRTSGAGNVSRTSGAGSNSWAPLAKAQPVYEGLKKIIDILGAFLGLILASPLLLIFGVLIKLESPGPVLYSQLRVGKRGRPLRIYKLRSMWVDAEEDGPQWAEKDDPRVTPIGRFIRRTRIDEIPQFINVLKGEMSLVGPRPERPDFTLQFNREIPGFILRLQVKPGITGLAQVNGGYEISPREKLGLDLEYIRRRNLWLDLQILAKTVMIILTGNGAR